MARKTAKKYNVGVMSRKDLSSILEYVIGEEKGFGAVFLFSHRNKKYEVRGRRQAHGVDISWGLPGTFFLGPAGYDNQ